MACCTFYALSVLSGKQSGTTAAVALIVNGVLHVLNCGDSR
jgi:serine/threonine protein phosphatase PrpC